MIEIKQGLSGRHFSATVPDLVFGIGGACASVSLSLDGGVVYSERLYPVGGAVSLRELGDLVRPWAMARLVTELRADITELDAAGGALATASQSCEVVYCEADIDIPATEWCDRHFLSLLLGDRTTAMGRAERLHYTGTGAATVAAEYADGSTAALTAPAVGGNARYTTVDCSPALFARAGRGLVAYTVTAGARSQRFVVDPACPDCAPILLFDNSFGCEELLYCTGTETLVGGFRYDTAYIGGLNTNYRVTETASFKADTGPLTFAEADWCRELFRSRRVRVVNFAGGAMRPGKEMVVSDPKVEYSNDLDALPRVTFTIQYAQRNHNVIQASREGRVFDNTFDDTFN